jgi:predicted glutamine amidotransferase
MCRWLAYYGHPIYPDEVLFKPENSLIRQSLYARRTHSVTNGDGFGIGWYGEREEPGLFRDVLPAWNDDNLLSLSGQIRSPLFFAHVRASTGAATARANCHPFRAGRWLFMHNGQIGDYERARRALDALIPDALYGLRTGTTDSEAIFLLLLANGLDDDPRAAFAATVAQVESVMAATGCTAPLRLTASATDGRRIHALRYATGGEAPSLFYGSAGAGVDGATMILSEPLDSAENRWIAVPDSHLLEAGPEGIRIAPFAPATDQARAAA